MRALLDEMLPPAIAEQLRQRGHDVIAVAERPDLRSLPDRDVFAFAQSEGRAIVTRDVADDLEIERLEQAAGHGHSGLILVSTRFKPAAIGPLVKALDALVSGEKPYSGFVNWL